MSEPPPDRGAEACAAPVWMALAGLAVIAGIVPLGAGWLNGWTLFAFPFGTFVAALLVPAMLFGLAVWLSSRLGREEPEE